LRHIFRRPEDRAGRLAKTTTVPIESERRLQLFVLRRFLEANRVHPAIQVRGRLSLENAR
jgi:hypothetical protein